MYEKRAYFDSYAGKRIAYIDVAKGILIILVVIGHILKGSVLITKAMIRIINAFHMPAFLVISGLLISETKLRQQNFLEFVKKRAARLLIPYVIFELIGGFWQMLLMGTNSVNINGIISGILTVRCHVGANWFLISLFFSELFLYWLIKIKPQKWYYFATACFFAMAFILPEPNWLFANIRRIAATTAFVLIGMYGKRLFEIESKLLFVASVIALIMGATINTGTASIALRLFQNPFLFVLCGIWGTYATLYVSKWATNCKGVSSLLEQCGKASLVIMGTHQNILIPFNLLLGNWTSFSIKLSILVITIITEIFCIIFCKKYIPSWVGEKQHAIAIKHIT